MTCLLWMSRGTCMRLNIVIPVHFFLPINTKEEQEEKNVTEMLMYQLHYVLSFHHPKNHITYRVNKRPMYTPLPRPLLKWNLSCFRLGSAVNRAQPVSTLTSSCSRRGWVEKLSSSMWFRWWRVCVVFKCVLNLDSKCDTPNQQRSSSQSVSSLLLVIYFEPRPYSNKRIALNLVSCIKYFLFL